jgi:toxin HigB-1
VADHEHSANESSGSLGCSFCNSILYICQSLLYNGPVIKSFRHAGLKMLFQTGASNRVRPDLQPRALRRLDAIDQAGSLVDLHLPGMQFHRLQGKPIRYSLHINGPWCITFEWTEGDAYRVDLEQYH